MKLKEKVPAYLSSLLSWYMDNSPETYASMPSRQRAAAGRYERWKHRKGIAKRTKKMSRVERSLQLAEKQGRLDLEAGR